MCTIFVSMSRPIIMVKIFGEFLIFYQIFLSPQMGQNVIISNNHDLYAFALRVVERLRT